MGRFAARPRLSDGSSEPEPIQIPARWSMPSDASVPLLDLNHRVPVAAATTLSSLALDRELEMDLEASDNTFRRREEAALRVSEHQNPFSSSRLQPFHHMSEHAVARTMALGRARQKRPNGALDDMHWKLVRERADIRVYRQAARRGKTTSMLAQGLVRGSLAELMDGLYAETTKEARVLYPLLSPAVVDVAVLHVDSYRTAQHPFQFAGVTWMALETPAGGCGVCKDRDFVCFKKMGMIKDPTNALGDDIGFLTLLSVDQSEASTMHTTPFAYTAGPDFVRGFLSLTAYFKKLPNGLVSLFVTGDFNARGHLTARLADLMFAELVFALGNAAKCGQAKSLAMLLQSMSAGQLPSGAIAASASGSQASHLLPLLTEKNRDRCGVCSKTLWRVLESPEFCRSCWTRTCRNCHVTMPIYCADFHRAHDDDSFGTATAMRKKKFRRLPKPCKETFCLKCVCSVLPNGIKMNAKLLQQTAKKKKYVKKHGGGSIVTDPSLLRRGVGRTAASARHVPTGVELSSVSKSGLPHARGVGDSGASSRNGREPGKLYVQIPPRPRRKSRGGASISGTDTANGDGVAPRLPPPHPRHPHDVAPLHFDDHSSISVLSSVESEKLQRQRLSLNKSGGPKPSPPGDPSQRSNASFTKKQPSSMLEVLESYQLSQQTTTMSADYSEPLHDPLSGDGLSYNSYSSASISGAIYPADQTPPPPSGRKLELRVNLTPRKRARRSSTASSRNGSAGGSVGNSSKRTNPPSSARHSTYDDAYYNQALQRYLEKRRSSLMTTSSTMSTEQFSSLDKATAEATALAATAGARVIAPATVSTSSGSVTHDGARDAHKLRILRDLEPFPRTDSFFDRPRTPSRISISSFGGSSFDGSLSELDSSNGTELSGLVDPLELQRPKASAY